MGDDILDIPILKNAGISCCPQDAVQEVKKYVTMFLSKREVVELSVRLLNK